MMKANLITRSLFSTGLLTLSASALAAGTWAEARNDAMGGTGVASAHYGSAPLVNPALLTQFGPKDDLSIILPSVGARVSDPDNLVDGFDDVKSAWDAFDAQAGDGTGADSSATNLKQKLQDISGHQGKAEAAASAAIAVPNATLPFAFVAKGWGTANAKATVTQSDLAYLDAVGSGAIQPTQADLDKLTSRAEGLAALVTEYGVSVAHQFDLAGHPVSVGVTPKVQRVSTYNYNVAINNFSTSDFRGGDYERSETGGNVDVGLATNLSSEWTVGLVAQNLVARSVETKEINGIKDSFKVRPQATVGTAWSNGIVTTALDIDLTPASGFASEEKSQYAGIGAELNAWSWAQLRAGYRADMRNSDNNAFTAGIGLSPFDVVHLDLTGLVGSGRTYGVVAQLTYTF
ncbi:conjugal transfer protein TraF [Enterobacteriales bacterium SAP-6]|uniref:Conjugal transfer protein TraF n=2 Tax=Acerihabitans arboris TaxID=2691583 RepID=A0A845SMT0_9GAMM|nr:conjugal transfer protein TraF [Acerihabitans arboris]NDL64234.1 conjugal transfer protein TraF [Acerihabitans arboris]